MKIQRMFIKLATNRFSMKQLKKRGFQVIEQCRRGCNDTDDLHHLVERHVVPVINDFVPRSMIKSIIASSKTESFTDLDSRFIALIASVLSKRDNLTPAKVRKRGSILP